MRPASSKASIEGYQGARKLPSSKYGSVVYELYVEEAAVLAAAVFESPVEHLGFHLTKGGQRTGALELPGLSTEEPHENGLWLEIHTCASVRTPVCPLTSSTAVAHRLASTTPGSAVCTADRAPQRATL